MFGMDRRKDQKRTRARRPGQPAKQPAAESGAWANRTVLRRTLVLMLIGVMAFLPLAGQLFDLMILQHDDLEQRAISNQTSSVAVTADRGVIYDRNMNILATSKTVENVFLDPIEIRQKEQDVSVLARGLAEVLGVEESLVYEQAADTTKRYKVIKRRIEEEEAQKVRDFINEENVSGVYLEPDSKRYYPYGSLCAQVLGFTRSDNVGSEGIEAYYDSELSGTAGKIITTKGNNGSEMLYTHEKYYDATNGNSLVLTLDTSVQYYLEKNLENAMEKYDVLNGAFGLVADVNTGEILGMATLGSYDPNNYVEIYDPLLHQQLEEQYLQLQLLPKDSPAYQDAIEQYNADVGAARLRQWRNRAVSDGYEPGSTFKVITLASALEEQAVTLDSQFYCGGVANFKEREKPLKCWKAVGHGAEDTRQALANSCNIAFANIGLALGGTKLYDYVKDFGLLEKTGIDLPGEASGFFYSRDAIDPHAVSGGSNTITASFGQSFKITPIQLVRAISAVVNGGYLLEPHIVSQVLDETGAVVHKNERTVIRQVISAETSATMRELMENVVTNGTAGNAKVAGYRIGGKTGTSEKLDVKDENGVATEDKIVSFIGVAPIDDPQYIVLVGLDTPSTATGIYISGGVMAAPTVGYILSDILPYLGVEPNYSDDDIERVNVTVPNVVTLTEEEAAKALREKNLTYVTVGDGEKVTDMVPAANAEIPGKSEVVLYMGEAKPTERVTVPDFTGMNMAQANEAAVNNHLYVLARGTSYDGPTISVTWQNIDPGTEVVRGTTVTVEFTDHSAQD